MFSFVNETVAPLKVNSLFRAGGKQIKQKEKKQTKKNTAKHNVVNATIKL